MNVKDFNARQWRERQFSRAGAVAGSAAVGRLLERSDAAVDHPRGWLGKVRVVLL
jgi:hypothetical protein